VSERYGEITERIEAVRQLGSVVNVMRGTAGARAARAREGLGAVRDHAAVLADAIRRVLTQLPEPLPGAERSAGGMARVVFGAEQGFVGGFTERILDALAEAPEGGSLLLVGRRAAVIAAERGIVPVWQDAMPFHVSGIPARADRIVDALFRLVAAGGIERLEAVWASGGAPGGPGPPVQRRQLFPLRPDAFADGGRGRRLLLYRRPELLLQDLTEEHVHAQLCDIALRAFAAENEARMAVMTAAHRQVDRRMEELLAERRQLRQEEITAEIIELSTGILGSGRSAGRSHE